MAEGEILRFPVGYNDADLYEDFQIHNPIAATDGLNLPFLTEVLDSWSEVDIPDVPAVISESPLTSLVRYWREATENGVAASSETSVQGIPSPRYLTKRKTLPAPFPTFAKYATSLPPCWRDVADCEVTDSLETPPQEFGYLAKANAPPAPFPSFAKYATSLPPCWREKTECELVASSETSDYLTKVPPAPFPPVAKYVTSLPPCWREKTECEVIASPRTPERLSASKTSPDLLSPLAKYVTSLPACCREKTECEVTASPRTPECLSASKISPEPFSPLAKYVTSLPPCWREKTECEVTASPETVSLEVEASDYFSVPKTPPAPFPSFAKYATSLPHRPLSDYELIASSRDFVTDIKPNLGMLLNQLEWLVLDHEKPSPEFDDDIKLNWTQLQQLEAMANVEFPLPRTPLDESIPFNFNFL